ncbi:uncharacterized protein LOC135838078 [Planococcus citri]|uniref:uncharacterized protein LOC135838078 n=1 Tax=Planococcus citri TaxID=170843 RepID=UPI0031F8D399
MENASDGCVRRNPDRSGKTSTKPYVNKPIFRRKLIEKYSTARYNINTKRVAVQKSPTSQTPTADNAAAVKVPLENGNSSSPIENHPKPGNDLQTSPGSSKNNTISTTPTARKLVYKETSTNTSFENDSSLKTAADGASPAKKPTLGNSRKRKLDPSAGTSTSSAPKTAADGASSAKEPTLGNSRKRKLDPSAGTSTSSAPKAKWRIAPRTVYNSLWDLYQNTLEIKTEDQEPEHDAKKETKKRKDIWSRKQKRRKPLPVSKKPTADRNYFDPYVECLKEAETQSANSSPGLVNDKLGIVMYLGVNRPLFPLMYRNLRSLNGSNDQKITAVWSEFALSTLITKPEDKKCTPILVPIRDPELATLASECLDGNASPAPLNVSITSSATDEDATKNDSNNLPVEIKREDNDTSIPVGQKKRKYSKYSSIPKSYELRRTIATNDKKPDDDDDDVPEPEKHTEMKPVTPVVTSSPEFEPQPIPQPSIIDEKAILKKFGYKECFVAIPKLSDTLIKYLSAGNYSNQSAELKDPTERELIEETDDFGLIQCTRTDGIIIDYVTRNRSLVYFYKLKKMLDFQKTNNKYFVSCDYILIDNVADDEEDVDVDIVSVPQHDERDVSMKPAAATHGPRNSKNPNDLFKSSKISEWKDKSNNISWVKNNDLKCASDVKWLLISLDKHIASLSYASGCVLRYRLLFEIIYRAELSKKVICCELSKASDGGKDSLTFGVYAFPGLCDKVLVGPYLNHEEHQLSAIIRTSNGSSERTLIKTLEEKENLPQQSDESHNVKHINAKWWSGKRNNDLTEQYLNFFFNPSAVKCAPTTDRLSLAKIISDHPCHNYHAYEITGRESNLVLFHDRTNAIPKTTTVTPTEIPAQIEPEIPAIPASRSKRAPTVSLHPAEPRNLRKKPRRDYSQLITDDMAIHPNYKYSEFYITDVKSLRKRPVNTEAKPKRPSHPSQPARSKMTEKLQRASRYHESPEMHIMNERVRRLEFRNRRNDLASVLQSRPDGSYNAQPLVSILIQAKEIITYLEVDNNKLDEEAKRLRTEQSALMRTFTAKIRSHDIKSEKHKNAMAFLTRWKQMKADQRYRLIDMLGHAFDKPKPTKVSKRPAAASRTDNNRSLSLQRHFSNLKKQTPERAPSYTGRGDELTYKELDSPPPRDEDVVQRTMSRIRKRQKMRDSLRNRKVSNHQVPIESLEYDVSEQVVCEDGKSSDPLGSSHMLDDVGEIPIIISNMPPDVDPYAADPLADYDDGCDASSANGKFSASKRKYSCHPLYWEHNYCNMIDEPPNRWDNIIANRLAQSKSRPVRSTVPVKPTTENGYRPNMPIIPQFGPLLATTTTLIRNSFRPNTPWNPFRPNNPIIGNGISLLHRSLNTVRTRGPKPVSSVVTPTTPTIATAAPVRRPTPTPSPRVAAASTTPTPAPTFQIRINDTGDENLGIDILDNGRMFARLNIAKINPGGSANKTGTTSSSTSRSGIAGTATSNKIMTIIQRFLQQMEKTSPATDTNDDERTKQAKRNYVVNSLKSFISKFESRRRSLEECGDPSSQAFNADEASTSSLVDNIELESGYSSKSEESCDREYGPRVKESPAAVAVLEPEREPVRIIEQETIENIVVSDEELSQEEEVEEDDEDDIEEEVVQDDELIAEEEEEEEIVGEEELIEEEDEEEEIETDENTLQQINDVDAAMRVNETDPFAESDDDSTDSTPLSIDQPIAESLAALTDDKTELSEKLPKVIYATNKFTIIRPKNKFIPNIMKTPTTITVNHDSASDHLSRIRIKPSIGSLVKLSTASLQLASKQMINQTPSWTDNNKDSIIKRLWYSPVSKTDEADVKVVRRESLLNEPTKTDSVEERDTQTSEEDNSNDEKPSVAEKDNSGAKRIVIKSFANHEKFREAFLSNVDKLLTPET